MGRFLPGFAVLGCAMALAACQSGDSGGGSGNMLGFGGAKEPKPPEEGKVLASELTAYCPRVIVKEAESTVTRYAKGGEGDPAKLSWQASITESTRSCSRQTGMLQMNVAVAGRVVPGPAGASGTITLPVKVTVMQGDGTALYTQTFNQQVALAGTQAQQFLLSDQNVVVPIPADNTLQVFAGFDTGTSKKKQSDELF